MEFLARSIESTIEKHEKGEGIFFSNLFSTISTNETKKHAFKFNIFVNTGIRDLEMRELIVEHRFTANKRVISSCLGKSFQSREPSSKDLLVEPPLKFIGSLHFLFFANFLSRFIPFPIINPLSIMSSNGSIMRRDCWL